MKIIFSNKIFRISLYFILVTILLWGILNSVSYLIVKTYLNSGYFKEKIIEKLSLNKEHFYILEAKFAINWSPFLLNTRIADFKFYDEKQEVINIIVKDAIFGFSIVKLASGNFIPSKIKLSNGSIYLGKEFFIGYGMSPRFWKGNSAAAIRLWKGGEGENHIDQDRDKIDDQEESFFKYILNIKALDLKNINFLLPSLINKDATIAVNHFIEKFKMNTALKKVKISFDYHNDEFIKNINSKLIIKLFPKKHQLHIVENETKIELQNIPSLSHINLLSLNSNSKAKFFFKNNFLIDKIIFNIFDIKGVLLQHNQSELKINKSSLSGDFNANNNKINLQKADIDFNNGLLNTTNFSFNNKDNQQKIQGELNVKNFQARDLLAIWPDNFFTDTNEWYEAAIKKGEVESGQLKLDFILGNWQLQSNQSKLSSEIQVKNTALLCCGQKFPLVEDIQAKLNINLHKLTATINKAKLDQLNLNKAKAILNLDNNDLIINGSANGKLRDFIKVYDPNYTINILGENIIENIEGDGLADFTVKTNLSHTDNIDQNVALTSKNFTTHLQDKKLKIHEGQVKFNLNNNIVTIETEGLLNEHKFNFTTDTTPSSEQPNDVSATHKAKLLVNYQDIKHILDPIIGQIIKVDKIIAVDAIVTNKINGDMIYDLKLDLLKATLEADYIKLKKLVGMDSKASFSLLYTPEEAYYITNFEMILAGNSITPKIFSIAKPLSLDNKDLPKNIIEEKPLSNTLPYHKITVNNISYIDDNTEISKLKFNDNEVESIDYITEPCKNNLYINASKIYYHDFDWLAFSGNDEGKENRINGKIQTLILADNLLLKDLDLEIACDKKECYSMKLNNLDQLGRGTILDAEMIHNVINVHSDNAGLLLRGLDITQYITGGKLFLEGYLNEYSGKEIMLENALHITNFHVHKAPPMAHLLALASPTGIISGLTGQGMSFNKFDSNFIFLNDKIKFGKSIADGSALALAFEGLMDTDNSVIAVEGSIIPFNIINIILRKIPVIGEWLVGKPGEGLITVDFTINGSLDKPDFKVNPFKIFIPHTLKKNLYDKKIKE